MKRKILLSLIPVASTSLLAATVISCDKKEDPDKKPGDDNLDPKPNPDPNESDQKTPFITKVETNEALDLIMKNKNNADFVLLDVRDPGEWEEGYIDNPVKISYNNRKTFAAEINKLDKKKTYLIYCRTQNRSQKAAKEIKEMGFDYIYWMNGGYTQWAKEGKPITTPEKQKVVTELRVKNATNIFKNINEAKIKLDLTNIGAGSINHVSDFTFKLFADDKELAKKELAKLENNFEKNIKDIFENITFENDKKYTIQIETLTNDKYHGYATYVFELSQTKTQKTYDDYANNKAFDHFSKSKTAELNDEFLTKNYQNGLFKYFLANNKAEKVQINQLANNGKKTLVLFASTTCLACLDALKLMDKVNTDNYNYVKVMTSISENDTKSSIADSEKVLDQENLGHLKENTYYDAYDFIWRDRIEFKTTPKFVLLDEYGQIINMFGVDSTTIDPFLTEVNKKLSASFSDELTKKNGEPISPIVPENPQDDQQQPDDSDNQIDDSNLTKYRTFEQRQKMKQLPSDAEKYSKHSYAKALKNMELQKSDGTMIKLSEIVKDKTKPTVVFLGSTHCQWCIKKLDEYKNKDLSSLEYNLVYGMESNGSNWEQFVKDNGAEKLKDTVLFRDSQKKLIQLVPDASGIPQCFILDEELNFTMFLSNSAQASSWVNKIKGTISTLDENLTIPDDPNNTFDPYYGKYEEIKKQYPKDINRVPKRDIVAAEDELIIERKLNNFTDKEAEIKELRELFNQFIDDDKYHTYRVEKANYHARFMVDAMLEWFANDWVDHAYVQGGFYGTRFKTESISLNEDETEYDDQFIKLLSFSKYKNKNHPEFPKTIVNSLIWDQKYKNWFIQFINTAYKLLKVITHLKKKLLQLAVM
ncbi:rhodanese-like domain-containing protein [Mycoplasmopsis opalescens]|uniref:rhodanese-like domain-containing protein n=1 Tax=Mycoplasmopsis opalescens TaxID=114886 RepID=UPI00069065DB|nr:rhodanese-like domain-containing protein [Mycoplasmopsis opalescens]